MHTNDTAQPDPINVLGLSIRPYNALKRAGIKTVDVLAIILENGTIHNVRNLGQKGIAEIEEKLLDYLGSEYLATVTEALYEFSEKTGQQTTSCSGELSTTAEDITPSPSEPTPQPAWHFYPTCNLNIPPRLSRILERNHIDLLGQVAQIIEITNPRDAGMRGFGIKHLDDLRESLANCLESLPKSAFETVGSEFTISLQDQNTDATPADDPLAVQIERWLTSIHNERYHNILYLRYGLEQDPMTLEEVGQIMGVTRERIRQIECRVLRQLAHPHNEALIATVLHRLKTVFCDANGVLTDGEIEKVLADITPPKMLPLGLCALFAEISQEFCRDSKSQTWIWGKFPVATVQTEVKKILRNSGSIEQGALVTQFLEKYPDLKESFILACLRTLSDIELTQDGFIVPKWTRRRVGVVVQALRQIGHPAHYTEIAEMVNQLLPQELQQTGPHNVHAQLQRLPDTFVRVASGTYGLAEWGLERSEYYIDIIERIFLESGHPLTIQETLSKVCEIRNCRESTVTMLLMLNERFRAFPGNAFGLVEWQEEDYLNESYREKRLLSAITEDELLNRRKPQQETARTFQDIDNLLSNARSRNQIADLPLFYGEKS